MAGYEHGDKMTEQLLKKLNFDCSSVHKHLTTFIRKNIKNKGFQRVVIGLSGGIDSSLSTYLAKDALGKENVWAILMPYKSTSKESIEDAMRVITETGINYKKIDITPMADAYFNYFDRISNIRKGNVMARMRMIVLFDMSQYLDALVLGTSNKTEAFLGYGTWYGDTACSINPIGDLYKTQVRALAKYLNIPESILNKKPTADLWRGQTDEEELGFTYEQADIILYHLMGLNWKIEEIVNLGFSKNLILKIKNRVNKYSFKRFPPEIAKLN
jgi:NAD+ synthase